MSLCVAFEWRIVTTGGGGVGGGGIVIRCRVPRKSRHRIKIRRMPTTGDGAAAVIGNDDSVILNL